MDLSLAPSQLETLLTTTDGRKFRGIVNVNSVLRTQNDVADYLLQVNAGSFIKAGDAMSWDGGMFVLGTGVRESASGPLFRSFRMITVTHSLIWTRATTTREPISGLEQAGAPQTLGTALCNIMAGAEISDVFHVSDSKYTLITNSPVQVNDRLGQFIVTFVEQRHGLIYGEVR